MAVSSFLGSDDDGGDGGDGGGITLPPGSQARWTWDLAVGYTPVVDTAQIIPGGSSYDHLFLWMHPTGLPNAPDNSEVFDGGPAGNCLPDCGAVTAWISPTGQYNEVNNLNKNVFYSTTFSAETGGPVFGALLFTAYFIDLKGVNYSPDLGPNSNSVAYTMLSAVAPILGINSIGISQGTLPGVGTVGVMNVLGQEQIFTGWGQNILK